MKSTPLFATDQSNSLSGALHELSDQQIEKVLQLKFNNNAITLIKQLSQDLATKEKELILLRQEKFVREQSLIKLCSEYGNLSRIEIDNKLSNLNIEQDVNVVIGGLIEDAMEDNKDLLSHSSSLLLKDKSDDAVNKAESQYCSQSSSSSSSKLFNVSDSHEFDNKSWFNNLFESSGSNKQSHKISNKVYSRSYSDSQSLKSSRVPIDNTSINSGSFSFKIDPQDSDIVIANGNLNMKTKLSRNTPYNKALSIDDKTHVSKTRTRINNTETVKVPMEMVSFAGPMIEIPKGASVDKFGFFNDINHPEGQNELNVSSPLEISDVSLIPSLQHSLSLSGLHDDPKTNIESSNAQDRLKQLSLSHDASEKHFDREWHQFLTHLQKDYLKLNSDLVMEEQGSIYGPRGLNLINLDQKVGLRALDSGHYKTLIRLIGKNGLPPSKRAHLWFELSGAQNSKVPGEYQRLVNIAKTMKNDKSLISNLDQIELDLHRTMPSNVFFNDLLNSQPGPHFYRLKNILYAFVIYRPDIGYCQGMNKIISNLLLVLELSEEDIFWVFVSILEILPVYESREFFDSRSLMGIRNDQKILAEKLFPKYLSKIYHHFTKLAVQLEYITLNWWLSIFTERCLPIEIWIKFFENVLVKDCSNEFFLMSLSLFKYFEEDLLKLNTPDEVYILMKNIDQNSSTKKNIKYVELQKIKRNFDKKLDFDELQKLRNELINSK